MIKLDPEATRTVRSRSFGVIAALGVSAAAVWASSEYRRPAAPPPPETPGMKVEEASIAPSSV